MKLRHTIHLLIVLTTVLLIISNTYAQEDSVFTIISGDSVTVWNTNLFENCGSRFAFDVIMCGSDSIIITETDTVGPMANCPCYYDLSITLIGLGIGDYTVIIYRQYLSKYFYMKDTVVYIGSTSFVINQSPSMSYSQCRYQSSCKEHETVMEGVGLPNNFSLEVNYPNPANPSTQITYTLPKATNVTLKIYDLLGREVALLVDERKLAGEHTVSWNAEGVPSGVYFYRIVAGDFIETKKMVLIR